ncbi:MAG TPA: choice-of-anchor tandem repeat GloVer-containing protein [Candidatus Sulfotelmatobacter sp.]
MAPVVIGSGGVLYGTTARSNNGQGLGTVFSLTPPATQGGSWTETILHEFSGPPGDGEFPLAGLLIGKGGALYSTTFSGGNGTGGCCGTVFSLTAPISQGGSWTESILHNFTGSGGDGDFPVDLVLGGGGVLYGTTELGGTSGQGTVFSLKPPASHTGSWTETVLYSFTGTSGDGSSPQAGLVIDGTGLLYGTTVHGGSSSNDGIVFSLTP